MWKWPEHTAILIQGNDSCQEWNITTDRRSRRLIKYSRKHLTAMSTMALWDYGGGIGDWVGSGPWLSRMRLIKSRLIKPTQDNFKFCISPFDYQTSSFFTWPLHKQLIEAKPPQQSLGNYKPRFLTANAACVLLLTPNIFKIAVTCILMVASAISIFAAITLFEKPSTTYESTWRCRGVNSALWSFELICGK